MRDFSIPKYIYGNNIQMFLPTPFHSDFSKIDGRNRGLKGAIKLSYNMLGRFIERFFSFHFPEQKMDWRDVFISRIDFCFNQVFPSKIMAIDYLNQMKKHHKRYTSMYGREKKDFDTGITYTRSGIFHEKIYHKGTEYRSIHGDRNWHRSENKRKGRKYYDVELYQEFADRILRYEMTFHNGGIDYIHKNKIFRKKDEQWQRLYKDTKLLDKEYKCRYVGDRVVLCRRGDTSELLASGLRELDVNGKRTGKFIVEQDLPKHQKDLYKYVNSVMGTRRNYGFNVDLRDSYYDKYWSGVIDEKEKDCYFSRELFEVVQPLLEMNQQLFLKTDAYVLLPTDK